MSDKKNIVLSVRLDDEISDTLRVLESTTGVQMSVIARAAIKSVTDYYKFHGQLTFPLAVIPQYDYSIQICDVNHNKFSETLREHEKKYRKEALEIKNAFAGLGSDVNKVKFDTSKGTKYQQKERSLKVAEDPETHLDQKKLGRVEKL